jgi:hypothetical protein
MPAYTEAACEQHLLYCGACRAYLAGYEDTVSMAREVHGSDDRPGGTPVRMIEPGAVFQRLWFRFPIDRCGFEPGGNL